MFSKSKINDPIDVKSDDSAPRSPAQATTPAASSGSAPPQSKPKSPPSTLSHDLTITGNISTTGDVQVEGAVEGDIRAHLLTVGESATIRGEIVADDVVVNGRVVGRVRGIKVRLTSSARVEGDIIHKTIAIESGAHFEGSVQRSDDPLGDGAKPEAASATRSSTSQPVSQSAKPADKDRDAGE
ncbi:MAG TPA: polymer-forming cytoskeletal protein [Paracoccaceae bacterium]|nr:polymer-forming cytoskeletal protein [Paracoccaceae bacterium]